MKIWPILLTAILLPALSTVAAAQKADKSALSVLGYIEYVYFDAPTIQLKAKLDTGATTSSMNALNKEAFKKDGKDWMRFDVIDPEDETNLIGFEAPVVRTVRIRRHGGEPLRRPVVLLGMCVGNVHQVAEFSLTDRSDFNYQVLVGRNFLQGHIAVDSGNKFETKPQCKTVKGAKG